MVDDSSLKCWINDFWDTDAWIFHCRRHGPCPGESNCRGVVLAEYLRTHPGYQAELDDMAIELLYKSAPLHDIGKVGIPDGILSVATMKGGMVRGILRD